MKIAVVENGSVINIVDADAAFADAQGWEWVELSGAGNIGDPVVNGKIVAPVKVMTAVEYERARAGIVSNRITGRVSLTAQGNIQALVLQLMVKERAGGVLTSEESQSIALATAVADWVAGVHKGGVALVGRTDYETALDEAKALGADWNPDWDTFVARF